MPHNQTICSLILEVHIFVFFILCFLNVYEFIVESNGRNDDDNDGVVADEDDTDIIDMTMFEVPILPVTCGSGSGILHKYRFATGMWVGIFKK